MGKLLIDEQLEEKNANSIDWDSVDISDYKESQKTSDELNNLLSQYKEKADIPEIDLSSDTVEPEKPKKRRGRKPKAEKMTISGEIISGALFITLLDIILPTIIVTVNNVIDKKGKKMSVMDLRLKQTQKNELEPIADEVMKELMIKANPAFILISSFVSIYALNFVQAKYGNDG